MVPLMPSFGKKSRLVKETIHPHLSLLCDHVVEFFDITLLEGRRSKESQDELYLSGKSQKLWPESKHNVIDEDAPYPDNLSMAVDVAPWPIPEGWGDLISQEPIARDLQWKERVKFYMMVAVFKFAWAKMQKDNAELKRFKLRFGADWDGDNDLRDQTFDDLPHIELIEV